MKILLFGADADRLTSQIAQYDNLEMVDENPDAVICYGGDGTILSAELEWPCIPKVPIRNSRRGFKCLPHPLEDVLSKLASGHLVRSEYLKLECALHHHEQEQAAPVGFLTAINEFNVHMGRINSAVRFKIWIDDEPYTLSPRFDADDEIVGDGFLVCTPFGSTAYFNQITRGMFRAGLGIAFKYTAAQANHIIVPETSEIRVRITRGPAVLAFDNSPMYYDLEEDDELVIRKHEKSAILLTCDAMSYPSDRF